MTLKSQSSLGLSLRSDYPQLYTFSLDNLIHNSWFQLLPTRAQVSHVYVQPRLLLWPLDPNAQTASSKSPLRCLTGTLNTTRPNINSWSSLSKPPPRTNVAYHPEDAQPRTSPLCHLSTATRWAPLPTSALQPPLRIPTVITLGQATNASASLMTHLSASTNVSLWYHLQPTGKSSSEGTNLFTSYPYTKPFNVFSFALRTQTKILYQGSHPQPYWHLLWGLSCAL